MLAKQYQQDYVTTIAQLHRQLPLAGMNVKISFQMAGSSLSHSCDADNCRCGMAILLVYGDDPQPATLWVQGQADRSWVSVDDSLGHRISAEFGRRLQKSLKV